MCSVSHSWSKHSGKTQCSVIKDLEFSGLDDRVEKKCLEVFYRCNKKITADKDDYRD